MFFPIDPSNGVAIYDQIVRQVKFAVADGVLREGELAPSVRELARQLAINPNTVARAYLQLQSDEVLETIRGTGVAVQKRAAAKCRKEREKLIGGRLHNALAEACRSGLSPDDIRGLVEQSLQQVLAQQNVQTESQS